jgi:hypothetical protein
MRAWLILVFPFLATPAYAQLCNTNAGTLQSRATLLSTIQQSLGRTLSLIEAVPPDVATYLDQEKKAALEQENSPRFQLVFKNPVFSR